MIRYILLSIALSLTLLASEKSLQSKIMDTVIQNITISEQKIIYSDDNELLHSLENIYHTTQTTEDATILILKDKKNLPKNLANKKIFVLSYQLLLDIPQSFGAFFFKKGRANIVLLEPQLKEKNISVSDKLNPYIEEKIW